MLSIPIFLYLDLASRWSKVEGLVTGIRPIYFMFLPTVCDVVISLKPIALSTILRKPICGALLFPTRLASCRRFITVSGQDITRASPAGRGRQKPRRRKWGRPLSPRVTIISVAGFADFWVWIYKFVGDRPTIRFMRIGKSGKGLKIETRKWMKLSFQKSVFETSSRNVKYNSKHPILASQANMRWWNANRNHY